MDNTSLALANMLPYAWQGANTLMPYVPGGPGGDPGEDLVYGQGALNATPTLSSSTWSYNDSLDDGNQTQRELPDPTYYSQAYRVAGALFVSLIFLVGLGGNVMVVIVVARTRSMHTTTNCYLVSLAIADILVLISATLPTIWELFLIIDQCIIGPVGCAIMVFLQYLGVNTSSLSITAFTVERYIAICHPMRAQTMCTVKRAKRIIFVLWTVGILYCLPWLGLITVRKETYKGGLSIEKCDFKLERKSYLTYYMADLVIFYVFPLILTCVLYGLIARILFDTPIPSTPGKANGVNSNSKKSSSISSSRVQVGYRWLDSRLTLRVSFFRHDD